jgi:hypothetical protein
VDALCIVQDEEEKKQDELLKMSGIYAHATVTIIAAQGLSAESGLRGLQEISQPRDMRSSTHILGNGTTVIQFPVPYQREMSSESSVWGERAWTFQEQLFSRRRLVFDGDSVRWECSKAIWREHVDWTTILPTSKHNIDFPTLQSMLTAAVPNYNAFSAMLSDYNIRAFTYPEDALDAFSGTLAACSSAVGGDVISGLPTACFDAALLWSHDHSSDMRRRVARDPRKNHYLPSWSWAGWCGNLTLDAGLAQDFLKAAPRIWSGVDGLSYSASRVNLLVSWKWHETLGSDGVLIEPGLLQSRKKWLEGDVQSTGKWTRHSFCENTETKYPHYHPNSEQLDSFTHPEHPGFAFWYPVPLLGPRTHGSVIKAPYISCRTRRAWLIPAEKITVEEGPGWNDLPQISLRDSKGQWVGSLEPLVGIGRMREEYNGVALELAEIATGSYSNDFSGPLDYRLHEMRHKDRPKVGDWYEFYWVMWIEWENGIAYRRGLARVYKATWEMQPREEVDLILG